MALGLVLGGIAKGYQQGEELQNERAKRKALELETSIKAGDEQRKTQGEAAQAAIPGPGAMVPTNFDPDAAATNAITAATPTPPAHRAGILGALGRFVNPDSAAVASGVTPPPPQPTALPASPAAPADAGAPSTNAVDGVTVSAPQAKRQVTENDIAQMRWAIARKTGTKQDEMDAGEKYFQTVRNTTGKAIFGATDDQLGNLLSDATGKQVEIVPQTDKEGKPAGYSVTIDGQQIAQAPDRDHLNAQAMQMIERDPAAAFQMAHNVRQEDMEALKTRSEVARNAALAQSSLMEGRAALTNASTNAARGGREDELQKLNVQDRQSLLQAYGVLKDPDLPLTDPATYNDAVATIKRLDPRDQTYTQVYDSASGTTVRTPVSATEFAGAAAAKAFQTNPYVASELVKPASTTDGKTVFAVRDPKNPKAVAGVFSSSAQALAAARKLYGDVTPPKKK